MVDIKIDVKVFQECILYFVNVWKVDKCFGDVLFNGVLFIFILMGKVIEEFEFYKNNVMYVSLLILFWIVVCVV